MVSVHTTQNHTIIILCLIKIVIIASSCNRITSCMVCLYSQLNIL